MRFVSAFLVALIALIGVAQAQVSFVGEGVFLPPGLNSGFLSASTTTVGMTNVLGESNDLTNAAWSKSSSGGAIVVPTVTNITDTLPDGTSGTVSSIQFPNVTGASHFAVVSQGLSGNPINANPVSFSYWIKQAATPACGPGSTAGGLFISLSFSTTFKRAAIVADGNWHLIAASIPANTFLNNQTIQPQIGLNRFDAGQPDMVAACTPPPVEVSGGAIIYSPYDFLIGDVGTPKSAYAFLKPGGSIANTGTAAVSGGITTTLPDHVRFRNFAGLIPRAGNPVITANQSEVYQNGGLSNPYFSQDFQFGGFYWGVSNCTASLDHTAWMQFCLWKTTDWVNFTEVTTNAPYLQTFGSVLAKPVLSLGGSGFTGTSGVGTWTGGGCPVPPQILVTVSGGAITAATPSPNNQVGTGACPLTGSLNSWPNNASGAWSYTGISPSTGGATYSFSGTRGTVASGAPTFWELHGMFLPGGCRVAGVAHAFCILFSGINNTQGNVTLYEAFTDTSPDNVYTWVGCGSSGPCSTPTQILSPSVVAGTNIPNGVNDHSLVAIKNFGGTSTGGKNFIMVSNGGTFQGPFTTMWTTPADNTVTGAGVTLTYQGYGVRPRISGVDWDYSDGNTQIADPFIFLNHCGFYEEFDTRVNFNAVAPFSAGIGQMVGYAISDSLDHPFLPYQVGPIIPTTSPMYASTKAIGDTIANELSGKFIWGGNYDDGGHVSNAVFADMPQGICP